MKTSTATTFGRSAMRRLVLWASPCLLAASIGGCGEGPEADGASSHEGEAGIATLMAPLCAAPPELEPQGAGVQIPAFVQAEDYVAYSDTTPGNIGATAHPECDRGDDVDMEDTTDWHGVGCNIGWTAPCEWLAYELQAEYAQPFDIVAHLASDFTGRRVRIELDGATVGTLDVPSQGWQAFEEIVLPRVWIDAGYHSLHVVFENGETNLDYLRFLPSLPHLPAFIQAEDYDRYHDSTPENEGGSCDNGDAVDLEHWGDAYQCSVGWTTAGEWLDYDVWVPEEREYFALVRVASAYQGKQMHLEVNGAETASITAPSYGWHDYADRTVPLGVLPVGQHTIRAVFDSGDINFNYMNIATERPSMPSGEADFYARGYERFSDSTPENIGAASSPICDRHDAVDLEISGDPYGTCNIGWTTAGEWIEYDVWMYESVPLPRSLHLRLASAYANKTVRVDVDGVPRGVIEAPDDGWQTYESSALEIGGLEQGSHTIRVLFETGDVNFTSLWINTVR